MKRKLMKKRILSLLLTVCMIFTMLLSFNLPVLAVVDPLIEVKINGGTEESGSNLSDAISGTALNTITSVEITGGKVVSDDWDYIESNKSSFSELTSLTVAEAVYPVADIPYGFFFSGSTNKLQSVSIPNVTTIGAHAFDRCNDLAEVSIPDATTINEYAFWTCGELVDVEIPNVTTIGASAFCNCPSLSDIELPEVTSVGDEAFSFCTALAEISIPKLSSIGRNVFYACENLVDLDLPRVTEIGASAFFGCAKLNAVSIPFVVNIGSNAFESCRSLTALKVPGTPPAVTDTNSFWDCPSCRNLVFVDANGDELTDSALTDARAVYKAANDGNIEDNLWYGWNIVPNVFLDINDGDIDINIGSVSGNKITQGTLVYDNYDPSSTITITQSGIYAVPNKISVDGVAANITLDDVSIDVSSNENVCAFELTSGSNVDLTLSGTNSLTSGYNRAGLEVAVGQTVTIDGSDTDFLTATSKSGYFGAAGIGGGGLGFVRNCGTINIIGGNITATGGDWSTGIGGGKSGLGGNINISGGIITATGGGSGIGGGAYSEGGTINISGGNVTAIGGSSGIGGGYNNGSEGNPACDAAITIMEAATVKASSEYKGEAISGNGGTLEAASTAKILTANFSENQNSGTKTEVFNEVYGDTLVSSITPAEDHLSVAFTVQEGTYNLKTAGGLQQYTNTGTPAEIDFVIPDAAVINIFDEVEDAPMLTSVSISGTAKVGQTLTATVSPSGATVSYQWKANGVNIDGANGNTYIPAAVDIGKAITITTTATGEWFGAMTSSPTSPVIAASDNNDGNDNDNGNGRRRSADVPEEKPGLPYYIKDGKKVFIGFSADGGYTAPEGVKVLFGDNPKTFKDIENHWAKKSIDFVTEREIFQGIDENNFGPQISVTRGMFVTAIGRLYERSYGNVTGSTTFSDVDKDAYYAAYVAWAHENDIVKGIGNSMFAPDGEITREQMSAILYRFVKLLGKAPQGEWMINITYPDKEDISDWAMDSAAYCHLTGIISGGDDGRFAPGSIASRAEVATVFERFIKEMLK